mmetsp:Transcript_15777/g.43555  ORF Transcript_15777/g.43555 Transcript_15777/m.43555 type:complete len:202 (+) Transcript_15777:980-1585(+)
MHSYMYMYMEMVHPRSTYRPISPRSTAAAAARPDLAQQLRARQVRVEVEIFLPIQDLVQLANRHLRVLIVAAIIAVALADGIVVNLHHEPAALHQIGKVRMLQQARPQLHHGRRRGFLEQGAIQPIREQQEGDARVVAEMIIAQPRLDHQLQLAATELVGHHQQGLKIRMRRVEVRRVLRVQESQKGTEVDGADVGQQDFS